ncbi:hypothetical protein [Turicibacter sanguinis]|uniref:hypothetical protein n=1 Tax=Turicibacter sanguinis TaxID=154288 RepID=UPI0018AA356B|nr:hypothetical protein [Turicibacter sanguinis]MDB8553901.1 hypothetical protein [Turicibacter sanguinis]
MILELSEYQLIIVQSALNFSATQHFDAAMIYIGNNERLFVANLDKQQEYDKVLKSNCEQERMNIMLLNTRLHLLREEFKNEGYTAEQVEGIELSEGSGSVEARIENLETEKSYWGLESK